MKKLATYLLVAQLAVLNMLAAEEVKDFSEEPFEQLVLTEVNPITSVARKKQSSFEAPGAIFVLSKEDIVRSGYTTVPDLLRLVPGLHVARLGSNQWNITCRGVGDIYLNRVPGLKHQI